jgi:mannose-6-phosphate isomerase-like protein (cupin superfamily)
VLSGTLKVLYGDNPTTLESINLTSGQYLTIPSGKIHRMVGITDSYYLEASTIQLDDVIRIQDEYGRK